MMEAWWFLSTWWAVNLWMGPWSVYLETPAGNFCALMCFYALLPLSGGDTSLPALILGPVEMDRVPLGIQVCV